MRLNVEPSAVCCECGSDRNSSLELFDISIAGDVKTICDLCNEQLFYKSLKASYKVNSKLKSKSDIEIIRMRSISKRVMEDGGS